MKVIKIVICFLQLQIIIQHKGAYGTVTTSGNPSGIHLVEVDRNRTQSNNHHGMSQSESEHSNNNLTSAGNPLGIKLLNGFPKLGNHTSTKQPETGKK